MDNKKIAELLDRIRDKSYDTLSKEELNALVEAANILRIADSSE